MNHDQWTSSRPATHRDKGMVKAADIPVFKQCCQIGYSCLNVLCWVLVSPAFYQYSTNTSAFEGKRPLMLGHLKFVFPTVSQNPCKRLIVAHNIAADSLNDSPKATKMVLQHLGLSENYAWHYLVKQFGFVYIVIYLYFNSGSGGQEITACTFKVLYEY